MKLMNNVKSKIEVYEISEGKNIEKLIAEDFGKMYDNSQMVLNLLIHTADVSNPGKSFVCYKKWVDLVFGEFFMQGDVEKKMDLPVTILCDRETTSISKSQIGFINFVVKPTFDILLNFIPEVSFYLKNLEINLNLYERKLQEEIEAKSTIQELNSNIAKFDINKLVHKLEENPITVLKEENKGIIEENDDKSE